MNSNGESPSRRLSRHFPMLIGKNSRGQWVVRSQDGLSGGLFVNRIEAQWHELIKNGRRLDAVIMVLGCLQLALSEPVNLVATAALTSKAPFARSKPARTSLSARHASELPAMR
jgi:hypothetical protein